MTYQQWNQCLYAELFQTRNIGHPIRLSVDPIVLQRAAIGTQTFLSPHDAADDFRLAVRSVIGPGNNWEVGRGTADGPPMGLAKLAFQVLAVFGVSSDDPAGNGYWAALRRELGRPETKQPQRPPGLSSPLHETNWNALTTWANATLKGSRGILPTWEQLLGPSLVRWPLGHGLLRQADIRRLPAFFRACDYLPEMDLPATQILSDLTCHYTLPSTHAQRVMNDPARRNHAVEQIRQALGLWDGSEELLLSHARTRLRMWIRVKGIGNESQVVGGVLMDTGDHGNDEPIRLGGRTEYLHRLLGEHGLHSLRLPVAAVDPARAEWTGIGTAGAAEVTRLYRPLRPEWLMSVRSEVDGLYREMSFARPNDDILILHPSPAPGELLRRLRLLAVAKVDSIAASGDWVCLRLRLRADLTVHDLSPILRGRIQLRGTWLSIRGGLQLHVRWHIWMEGAGPTIEVRGDRQTAVIVDGVEFPLVDHLLTPERCPALGVAGGHTVSIPGSVHGVRRFRVEAARMFSGRTDEPDPFGWVRRPGEWPTLSKIDPEANVAYARGPEISEGWPSAAPPMPPATEMAMRLVRMGRTGLGFGTAERAELLVRAETHENLLVRQLGRWNRRRRDGV